LKPTFVPQLSPKKTLEGFIGGGLLTVLLGTLFSHWLSLKPSMYCPVQIGQNAVLSVPDCHPPPLFEQQQIQVKQGNIGFDLT
jgi:phosphatidate cytidylyltransferase